MSRAAPPAGPGAGRGPGRDLEGMPDDGPFAEDLAFAVGLAERAGRLLAARVGRVGTIDYKSARDIVTEVDHAAEGLILRAIRHRFPGDGFLGEEVGSRPGRGPTEGTSPAGVASTTGAQETRASTAGAAAEAATSALAAGRTWVVDPVDGTINYANGIPFFCVSLALVVDGRPVVGVVRDPMRRETFAATAIGPARLDGRPIRVTEKERLSDFVVALTFLGGDVAGRARRIRRAIRMPRTMGSAALSLSYVANGRFDAYSQTTGLSAWDVAAAGLIAERAGAVVTNLLGGPWFRIDAPTLALGVLAAPPAHHARLLELLRED